MPQSSAAPLNGAVLKAPTAPGTRHGGHLVPLDGLRGIAIVAVMLSHFFAVDYQGHGSVYRLLGDLLHWGLIGVDLFFVLSGFLITGILIDASGAPGFFRNFYMRRVLRIFPLYYGALLLLAVCTPVLHLQWNGIFLPMALYLGNIQKYQQLAQTLGGGVSLNHFWSLAVEEQFYLVWPLLVFLARTRARIMLISVAGVVGALLLRFAFIGVWHDTYLTHFSTAGRADTLLAGAALAVLYRSSRWPTVLRWSRVGCLSAVLVFALSLTFQQTRLLLSPYWTEGLRYSVLAVAAASLLAWTLRNGRVAAFFSTPVLRFLGRYSYGLYVLHMLFLPGLSGHLRPWLLHLTGSKLVAVLGNAALLMLLSITAAYVSFHVYEAPFLKLKRFFEYRRAQLPQ